MDSFLIISTEIKTDKTLLTKKKLKNSMNFKLFPLAATFSLYFMKSQSILVGLYTLKKSSLNSVLTMHGEVMCSSVQ